MRRLRHFAAAAGAVKVAGFNRNLRMLTHFRRSLILLCVAALLAACSSLNVVPATTTSPTQLNQASILAAINAARKANGGHKALAYNVQLEAACRIQVGLMVQKDVLAHDAGMKLRARVSEAGYHGAVGENLAGGQQTLEQAIEGWLNSPGHRSTLLNDKWIEFGVAVQRVPEERNSRYGIYWCFIAGGPFEAWLASR